MRGLALLGTLLVLTGSAAARPPPPPEEPSRERPPLEWSTWFRLGFGMQPRGADEDTAARATTPVARGQEKTWEAALGADLTMGLGRRGDIRLGAWMEARGLSVVGGGELVIQRVPRSIDMFFYRGQGVLAVRAGGNHERLAGQVAYGYLAPWKLWGPWAGTTRYMIGVRFVASYTRAIDDPHDWTATLGLEFEPVGAIRYLLGIRSWY